jgi:acetoacetyl-CoA synthetase
VLERSPIHENDNFFELGGNPSLAVRLLDEISRQCRCELPPLAIYHAPTIVALAALFEQPRPQQFSPLVPLKAGNGEPPVFIAHGLGGTVLEFFELVKRIETSRPIYGLQGIAETGADVEFERIEDIAQFYVDAIRRREPRGPYLLAGYSLGGLVMLEIASRLAKSGGSINLLTLLDAYPHERILSLGQRARHAQRLVRYHASMIQKLPMRSRLGYIWSSSERLVHPARRHAEDFVRTPHIQPMKVAREKAYKALMRYQPPAYEGKIKFVQAAEPSVFPLDPAAVWRPWVRDFEVDTVPGDHHTMINYHSDYLASLLSRYLREAG